MAFNKDLFIKLCKEYGVEFASKSGNVQVIIDGVTQDLTPKILKDLLT